MVVVQMKWPSQVILTYTIEQNMGSWTLLVTFINVSSVHKLQHFTVSVESQLNDILAIVATRKAALLLFTKV